MRHTARQRWASARTCCGTLPFPWPPGQEPADDPRVQAIARAAQELVRKRDAWLDLAHRTLDHAVLDAYGWPQDLGGDDILRRLLALNLERGGNGSRGEAAGSAGP